MAVVGPSRMIYDRVKTHAVNTDETLSSERSLFTHIPKPIRAVIVFDTSLGDDHRFSIPLVKLLKDVGERPINILTSMDLPTAGMMPLIMEVVI